MSINLPPRRERAVMRTPVTAAGLRRLDILPPAVAVGVAWSRPGVVPGWHRLAQQHVARVSPVLGAAVSSVAGSPGSGRVADLVRVWAGLGRDGRLRVGEAMPLLARALDRLADAR